MRSFCFNCGALASGVVNNKSVCGGVECREFASSGKKPAVIVRVGRCGGSGLLKKQRCPTCSAPAHHKLAGAQICGGAECLNKAREAPILWPMR